MFSSTPPNAKTTNPVKKSPAPFGPGNPRYCKPPKRQFLKEWIGAGIRPPRVTNASQLVWFTGMIGA